RDRIEDRQPLVVEQRHEDQLALEIGCRLHLFAITAVDVPALMAMLAIEIEGVAEKPFAPGAAQAGPRRGCPGSADRPVRPALVAATGRKCVGVMTAG